MMRQLFFALILVVTSPCAEAACVDPASLAHSAVRIARDFNDEEKAGQFGVAGIRGTGWFLSPTVMVTVAHVATAMKLSDHTWKPIDIGEGENNQSILGRIQRLVGSSAEKIAVLELQAAFIGAQSFRLRTDPLVTEEPLVSLAYPGRALRVARGRFIRYGDDERLGGLALLEMYDGDDRLVLDRGSSGAPVVDCLGRVVAVVSNLFTTTIQFLSHEIRVSTGWGNANVASVPVSALREFSLID